MSFAPHALAQGVQTDADMKNTMNLAGELELLNALMERACQVVLEQLQAHMNKVEATFQALDFVLTDPPMWAWTYIWSRERSLLRLRLMLGTRWTLG
mmetsp:Transcript_17859/g.62683  ORF Transcript_17859/g.62683 Transcript_17859/m.62683 type:complete len:97 (+) Transcript_17859:170-460(+)